MGMPPPTNYPSQQLYLSTRTLSPGTHGLPPGLAGPRLGNLAAAAAGLHLLGVEAAQVAGAHGVARLCVALLAAEAVLFVLLGSLVVDGSRAGANLTTAGAGALVVLLHLALDAHVEEIGLVGSEVGTAIFLSL